MDMTWYMTMFKIHLILRFKRQTWDPKIFQSSVLVFRSGGICGQYLRTPDGQLRTRHRAWPPPVYQLEIMRGIYATPTPPKHTPLDFFFPAKAPESLDSWKTFSFPYGGTQKAYLQGRHVKFPGCTFQGTNISWEVRNINDSKVVSWAGEYVGSQGLFGLKKAGLISGMIMINGGSYFFGTLISFGWP